MSKDFISSRLSYIFVLPLLALFMLACNQKPVTPSGTEQANSKSATSAVPSSSSDQPATPSNEVAMPMGLTRNTGDLDAMAKRRQIRALVVLNPIGFFYSKGHPQGVTFEALEEYQKFVNQKLKSGNLNVKVTYFPVRVDQIEKALEEGMGDM